MEFNMDIAIRIGNCIRDQDRTRGILKAENLEDLTEYTLEWQKIEELENHMMLMQDAGWLADVEPFNAGGDFHGRLTYQGHLWLEAVQNEGLRQRITEAAKLIGPTGAKTIIAEAVKQIAASVA